MRSTPTGLSRVAIQCAFQAEVSAASPAIVARDQSVLH